MHFEFLVEDQSSGKAMKNLIPKLLGDEVTFRIHTYKGIGRTPKDLRPKSDANKRLLLDQLPRILRGYGKVPNSGYIIIICDLDDKNKHQFLSELSEILSACNPKPEARFCLAIEEFEAWYLGDREAIKKAYPAAKDNIMNSYINDSICGTWEVLADAVYVGGHKALLQRGWQTLGAQKSVWAEKISPHMDINNNASPSFNFLCLQLHGITAQAT
ncbi:MAG: DUF4276 family protein [Clostridiales bacterium]|nr:DUF4276 family protein [Clostridiales bacterium]